jgi:hypothetical protein
MERIKCEICGKSIDIKYRNKDYVVYTHYFSEHIKRKYFCSGCLFRIEDMIENLKKIKKEEFLKKHPEYKYFNYLGQDRETRVPFYSLKKKLEKETWDKISDLFYFCGYSSDDDKKEPPDSARGRWVTHDPQKVMERLNWS